MGDLNERSLPCPIDAAAMPIASPYVSPIRLESILMLRAAAELLIWRFHRNRPDGLKRALHVVKSVLLLTVRATGEEGKRMASGLIGIQVPGNRLWVRVPCPPLSFVIAWRCVGERNVLRGRMLRRVTGIV